MFRFFVIDCFGDALRAFSTIRKAKAFNRNKPDCKVREISIFDLSEECLF